MELKKRTNGIWMVIIEGRRISTGEHDRKRAALAARIIIASGGRRPARKAKRSLTTSLYETYDRVWVQQKSHVETLKRVRKIAKDEGLVDVGQISYQWLVLMVERLRAKGNAPGTINRKLAAIRKTLSEDTKLGHIEKVPPMPIQREIKTKLRWLTQEEENRLVIAAHEVWDGADAEFFGPLVQALCFTGARIGEFTRAMRDRTYSNQQISFEDTKNGRDRAVPLLPETLVQIEACSKWFAEMDERHAADRKNPYVTTAYLSKRFERLRNAAGMPDVSLHTLRHTCASRLAQAGVDLYRVRDWLGHTSITTTERYAHLAPSSLDSAALALRNESVKKRMTAA